MQKSIYAFPKSSIKSIHVIKVISLLVALCLLSAPAFSQYTILYTDGSANPLITDDVAVCQSELFTNQARLIISSSDADNSTVKITMPPGMQYIPGCISTINSNNGLTIVESDISDLTMPVFDIMPTDLSIGDQITIQWCREADCDATAHQMSGGIFKDEIEVCGDQGCIEDTDPSLNSYDLLTPSVSMDSDGPVTAQVGENVCRNVTLTNGGQGYLDSLKYYIVDGTGTTTTAVTTVPGGTVLTPIVNGDTLCYWLTADVFAEYGNGDDFLDNGEQVMLERCYDVDDCDNASYYGAYWGCPGRCMSTAEIMQQTTIPNLTPNLSFGFKDGVNKDFCFKGQNAATGGAPVIQTFEMCNTGAGSATNLEFQLYNSTPGSGVGQNYFKDEPGLIYDSAGMLLGSTTQTPLYNGSFYQADCALEPHPAAMSYELDGIIVPAGECITIEISSYANNKTQECDATCNGNIAWYYFNRAYSYQDGCGISDYSRTRAHIAYGGRQLYTYSIVMPTDMNDCDLFNLEINYQQFYSQTKSTTEGSSEFKIDVSGTGLLYQGTGTEVFKGRNVTVTQVGDLICVNYPSNLPLGAALLSLPMKATCAEGSGTKSINSWHEGQYDDNCPGSTYHLKCQSKSYVMHCPDPCPEGGATPTRFTFERTSLGQADADNNGIPDGTGTADPADVQLHRASNCDTVKGTWEIYVHPNTVGPNAGVPFNHLYVEFDLERINLNCTYFSAPNLFVPLPDAEATIYPADGSPSFTCLVTPDIGNTGTQMDDLAIYDLSVCKPTWEEGDSVVFCASYVVNTSYHSSGSNVYTAQNQVYSSYTPNPVGVNPSPENKYTCDHYNDYMEVLRHYFSPYTPSPQTINGCNGRLNYYLRYYMKSQTGDIWYPKEYRPFTTPDKFTVDIDDALAYRPGSVTFAGQAVPDSDITQMGNQITICNLSQFFSANGGPLLENDETWSYLLSFSLDPTCEAEPGLYTTRFAGQVIGNGCHSPDMNYIALQNCSATTGKSNTSSVTYDGPQPFLTGGGTNQFTTKQSCWDVILNNGSNNINAPNTWFKMTGGSNYIVTDGTGAPIPEDANGFFQLGDNPPSNSSAYTICADSDQCDTTKVIVMSGFGCTSYPASMDGLSCSESVELIGLPLNSEVQLGFESEPSTPMPLCETQNFELKMTSAQAAYLDDPKMSILAPPGSTISNIMVEYPCGSGNFEPAVTTVNGSLILIDIEAHTGIGTGGIPGTIDALTPADREACITFDLDTDCDFISASGLVFQAFGDRPCGDPAINNGVRVLSSDLTIEGVNLPHGASVSIISDFTELVGCDQGNTVEVNVDFVSLGSNFSSPNDSIVITLDPHIEFVMGSVMCCSTDPAICPTFSYAETDAAGYTKLVLAFPVTPFDLSTNPRMCFDFEVINRPEAVCDEFGTMHVQVRASAGSVTCPTAPGGTCPNLQTVTGQRNINFTTEKIELQFSEEGTFECTPTGAITYDLPISIDSLGLEAGEFLVVDIHCTTASGTPGAYIKSEVINGPVAAGTLVNVSGSLAAGDCNPDLGISAIIGDPNQDGVSQCICEDLVRSSGPLTCPPILSHEKEFTSLTETAPGVWDAKWTITVTNTGFGEGTYNLNDVPGFDDDIEICEAYYSTTDAVGNPGNPGTLMLAIDGVFELAEDQVIAPGATNTYCLVIEIKYEGNQAVPRGDGEYTACESASAGDPAPGEGLYNESQLDTNDDGLADEVDEVCTDLPCELVIESAMPTACNPATGTYDLVVTVTYVAGPNCLLNIGGETFVIDNSGSQEFTISDLDADGATDVSLSAFFTCEATCFDTDTYDAPEACMSLECSTTTVDIECNGEATGSATVTATGGTAPYTYSWDSTPAQTTATATALTAGDYVVTVTDDDGTTTTCNVTINQPPVFSCSVFKENDITCNSDLDGSATVTPSGGVSPYTVLWSNGETTNTAIALVPGVNTVTVTDSNDCTTTCSVTIIEPEPTSCTVTASTDPLCAGESSGTITVSGTGGVGVLTFSLNGGPTQTSGTFTDVPAGSHVITVSDENGCAHNCGVTLTDPLDLSCTSVLNQMASCGMNDGSATVTPAGGTPDYTYAWDNTETTATAVALTGGTHNVTVTDDNGCTTVCSVVVTSTTGLTCEITNSTDVSCNGATDGAATVEAAGGTSPYTYEWSNAATTASITGLSGGTYMVTITDAAGCEVVCSTEIEEATELLCSAVKDNDITCNGDADGGATVTASGGTPGYTYLWTGGETTPSAFALGAGVNTVVVTDADGCTTECTVTIVEPSAVACAIAAFTNPLCAGEATGTITVSGSDGTGTLSYSLDGGAPQTSGAFTGVAAGAHTVVVTDANGCSTSCSQTLTDPVVLSCTTTEDQSASCDMSDGEATVTPAGGTAPYIYLWDNTETTATAISLSAGSHTVTVTDVNDCTTTCLVLINSTTGLSCEITSSSDVSCNAAEDGSVTVEAMGGTAPYIYEWSTGETTAAITGLSGGTYTVTITDAAGCSAICDQVVNEATELLCDIIKDNDITCNGEDDGGATVTASGGTPGYTYAWSTGETTLSATMLISGINSVTVTDADGCNSVCSVEIIEPTVVSCMVDGFTEPLCAGEASGTITVTAIGGTGTLSYSLDGGAAQSSGVFASVTSGAHTVVVTDANGCSTSCSQTLTDPSELSCSAVENQTASCDMSDGEATVTPAGGTAPYTYLWDNTETTAVATSLSAGSHTVTVTDASNCTTTCIVVINSTTGLSCSIVSSSDVSCNGVADGAVTVEAMGGTMPLSYAWSSGETSAAITGLSGGTYTVTITDAAGCSAECSQDIDEATELICDVVKDQDISCNSETDGGATVTASGGIPGYTYAWSTGETTLSATMLISGINSVTVTDADGCTSVCSVEIIEPTVVSCMVDGFTEPLCAGEASGTITVTAIGGTGTLSYSLDGGAAQSSGVFASVTSGAHTVVVTDANGCSTSCSQTLTDPSELSCSAVENQTASCDMSDGEATVTPAGGTAPYTYLWDNTETTAAATSLSAGSHTVTVTDANNCTTTCIVVINSTTGLSCNIVSSSDVSCNGAADGAVTVEAMGGTMPLSYAWSSGETTAAITGLSGGTYTVTITDATGCSVECSADISEATELLCDLVKDQDISCNGLTDGAATVTPSGGTPGYTYAWSSGETTPAAVMLVSGLNMVTVTDSDGCTAVCDVTIVEPAILECSLTMTPSGCQGQNDGTIMVSVMGGVSPFMYALNGGSNQPGSVFNNLAPGSYSVVVTDANACMSQECTIDVPVTGCEYDLSLIKELAPGETGVYDPNDDVTYRITVCNQAQIAADNIVVTDYIPSGMTFNATHTTNTSNGWMASAAGYETTLSVGGGQLNTGGLAAGECVFTEIVLRVDGTAPQGMDITNYAEISASTDDMGNAIIDEDSTPDDDDSNDGPATDNETDNANDDEDDHDPESIMINFFDLALSKELATGQAGAVAPGDDVTFTITIYNQGTISADNLEITDYIPTCMTNVDGNWSGAASGPVTRVLSVANGDLPAGGLAPNSFVQADIVLNLSNTADSSCDLTNYAEISSSTDDAGFNISDIDSTPDGMNNNDNVGGDNEVGNLNGDEDDHDPAALLLLSYDLALSKNLSSGQASAVAPGDLVTYDIVILNQGETNAFSIEITDYIPSCMSLADTDWTDSGNGQATFILDDTNLIPVGGLTPTSSVTVPITLQLDNPVDPSCDLTNWAEISSDDGEDDDSTPDNDEGNDPADEDDIDEVPITLLEFDLALIKSLAPGQLSDVMIGDDVTFTFTVFNQGQIPADNIEISDYIPADFILNDPSWSSTNPAVRTLTVANGDLPTGGLQPGMSATVDIVLQVQMTAINGNTYVNQGEISSATDEDGMTQEDVDSDPDNNPNNDPPTEDDIDDAEVVIMGDCDLALQKVCGGFDSNADGTGGQMTFDIIIINQGACTAYDIGIIDYILPHASWSLNDNDWYQSPFDGYAYYTIPGPLASGESDTVQITFDITSFDINDTPNNWAEIFTASDFNGVEIEDMDSDMDYNPSNDGPPFDNVIDNSFNDEDDHDYAEVCIPDLSIDKRLDPLMMPPYAYGDDIIFEICIENEGNTSFNSVTVTDYIPVGFNYDPALNLGWSGTAPNVSSTFAGPILPGDQFCTKIILEFVSGGMSVDDYTNVTEITETTDENGDPTIEDWDSTPANDDGDQSEDDEDAEVFRVFDLALTKTTTATGPFSYGQDITFDITVTNQGSVPAYDVELIDYLPCGYEFVSSAGWTQDAVSGNLMHTIAGPVMPGTPVVVPLTVRIVACNQADAWLNVTEISSALDDFGVPGDDLDSTADSDNTNDGTPEDNDIDNTNGDEDDHDPEEIEIYDIALQKVIDNRGPYMPGDVAEFKIVLHNQGNVAATDIVVTDYLNVGFSFDPNSNVGWTQVGPYAEYTYAGPLTPGTSDEISLFLEIVIPANADLDSWINEAEISGGSGTDADSNSDSDPDNDNDVQPGDDDDDEIDEHGNGDDEDDNDVADVLVTGEIGDTVWKDIDGSGTQNNGESGVAGVVVSLYDCNGNLLATETTDASGNYLFDLLLPGDYQLNFDISNIPDGCAFTYEGVGSESEDSDVDVDGNTTCITLEAGEVNYDIDAGLIPLAKVGDYIWQDCNGDGIQSGNEQGIHNIEVELYDQSDNLIATTFTNGSGGYSFEDLYPGLYYVKILAGDYNFTNAGKGGSDLLDSDVDDSNGPGTTPLVTLGPGDCEYDKFDAGLYECVEIGDLVWLDYNENDIHDPTENGINGIKVELYKLNNGTYVYYDYTYTGHKPGTPSDDGYFKFCVIPGTYYVRFLNPPATLVSAVPNFGIDEEIDSDVTGEFGVGTTDAFTVHCGQDKCDLGSGYYTQGMIGDYVWMDNNNNGTRESNEPGVGGIVVRAIDLTGTELASTVTDNNGAFLLDYLGKNTYSLKFDLPSNLAPTTPLMGNDTTLDSDIDGTNGAHTTRFFNINPGDYAEHMDAGLVNVTSINNGEGDQGTFDSVDGLSGLGLDARNDKKLLESKIHVYPNPVVDELSIDLISTSKIEELKIDVYDAQGRLVRSNVVIDMQIASGTKSYKIDVSDFDKGVYSLKVMLDELVINKKLIVID